MTTRIPIFGSWGSLEQRDGSLRRVISAIVYDWKPYSELVICEPKFLEAKICTLYLSGDSLILLIDGLHIRYNWYCARTTV